MGRLVHFMNLGVGRAVRVVLGVVLIVLGMGVMAASAAGIVVAIIGLVPIAMGLWGRCLLEFIVRPQRAATRG